MIANAQVRESMPKSRFDRFVEFWLDWPFRVSLCLAVLMLPYWWFFGLYLMPHTPIKPDYSAGFVVPFSNHGTVHYVTKLENWAFLVCAASIVVTVLTLPGLWIASLIFGVNANGRKE